MQNQIFRSADNEEYLLWLAGFLKNGGSPTNFCDYKFEKTNFRFLVAKQNFHLNGSRGILAVEIIVPKGIRCLGGDIGDCDLYFMDGFRNTGGGFIPVYLDTEFEKKEKTLNQIIQHFKEVCRKRE